MKIIQIHTIVEDYGDFMEIFINTKKIFSMSVIRDLSDAWIVVDMMKQAYEAGREGEDFIVEKLETTG